MSCGGSYSRELATVAQQRPEHVDESAGQGQQGLAVDEAFAAFAVVELPGRSSRAQAGQCCQIKHTSQTAVVAFRPS